jgi:hypothetical protein
MQKQRREFIRIATAGATGLALTRTTQVLAAWPSTGKMEINPDISNMRVVTCTDTAMMKKPDKLQDFASQQAAVDLPRLQANMDAMAMQLAQKTTADEAWKTIFRSSKSWASTLVAIKINVVETQNMAHLAILDKLCRLFKGWGVPPANIIVYDGYSTFNDNHEKYAPYFSPTDTSKIPGVMKKDSDALGGTTSASIPGGSSAQCTADIANGKVDILINLANNKGHSMARTGTLCMKNHFGTFDPNHNNINDYIVNINKSDAIIGGTPARQQLCFIDSLLINKANNSGAPEAMPCCLIMGTFAPAVDYLTIKKVREGQYSCTHDSAAVDAMVTKFGYTTSDPQWVVVQPVTEIPDPNTGTGGAGGEGGKTEGAGGKSSGAGGGSGKGSGGATAEGAGGGGGEADVGAGGVRRRGVGGGSAAEGNGGREAPSSSAGEAAGASTAGSSASGTTEVAGSSSTSSHSHGQGGTSADSTTKAPPDSAGCGCRVQGVNGEVGRWTVMLAVGSVALGQLRRLFKQEGPRVGRFSATDAGTQVRAERINRDQNGKRR